MNKKVARTTLHVSIFALLCTLPTGIAWADGAVYAMTNTLGNNQILVYHRASNGNLNPTTPIQTIATGGGGSGLQLAGVDSLGSAGSVQLDAAHHLLFAVNTETAMENNGSGSYNQDCRQGSITSFRVASDGTLTFADRVTSGGLYPNSTTVRRIGEGEDDRGEGGGPGELLYVLNAGGPGNCSVGPNITGFTVDPAGHMTALGSSQPVNPGPASPSGVNCPPIGFTPTADFACGLNPPSFPRSPAQVRFTTNGNQLIVTVKGTNAIYVFPVDSKGKAGAPTITQAPGPALPSYFAFTFDNEGHLLVTELFGTATSIPTGGAGAVSSFRVSHAGSLASIDSHVGDLGTAACWIALEPKNGHYAYVANNLSNNISSYKIAATGDLTLLNASAGVASGPNDLATATEKRASFLYVVDAGNGAVGAFQIDRTNGSLTALTGGTGLPSAHAQGLAAF